MDVTGDVGSEEPLRFTLLGPVRAWRADKQLNLGAARARAVVAALLLRANRSVGRELLIEAVWGEPAPLYAVNQLQKYVSSLRRVLEPGRGARSSSGILTWVDGGYMLKVEPDALDLAVFENRVAAGRSAQVRGETEKAAWALNEGLSLWDGPALANVSSAFLDAERDRLAEMRTSALEERIKADLESGRHGELVPELSRLAAEFPLRESFAALLMLALYRSGRQSDALTTFDHVRRNLREELGVDPGPELREMHERILASDASQVRLDAQQKRPPTVDDGGKSELPRANEVQGLHQLPMDIAEFVGREAALSELWGLVGERGQRSTSEGRERGVLISVIEGMAGVGKTRLAVHAAHQFISRDRFSDAQLWADLKGYSPDCDPADPARILEDFLRLLGVPGNQIPRSVEARAALYRDRLAGKRALVVLDNVADEEQVQHLLPGSASCLLLITSRRVLSGLDGARTVRLGVLSPHEAVTLIHRVAGREEERPESLEAARIAELSGRLPIAVALAGRRLRARPTWSMEELAGRLEASEERLGQLAVGRRAVDATFGLSYQALSRAQQRVFRLLALHPGEDCTPDAAGALLGTGRGEAATLMESLLDEHLLQQHVAGRYRYHDLLRLYARDRSHAEDSAEQRAEAIERLVSWYSSAAEAAREQLEPGWHDRRPGHGPGGDNTHSHFVGDPGSALQWLEQERANLLAVSREAARHQWHDCTWRLAAAAHAFLGMRSYGADSLEGLTLGLDAARRAGDRTKEAWSLRDLGQIFDSTGRHEEARTHHQSALAIFEETDDRHTAAEALSGLGRSSFCLGHYAESAQQHRQALALFEELGDDRGQASALGGLGLANWFVDRDRAHHQKALELFEELGDRYGQAYEVINLGVENWFFGNYEECARQHERALDLLEGAGDRRGRAKALSGLGLAEWHLGRPAAALGHYEQALTLFREICDRREEAIALQRSGYVYWATGRYEAGEKQLHETLALCEETGNRSTRAWALTSLGHMCRRLLRDGEAEEHLQKALSLSRTLGDRHPEAIALTGLALVRLDQGRLPECEGGARQALALSQSIGNPHSQAWAMITLGFACCSGRRLHEGADWHRQAAGIGHATSEPFTEAHALNELGCAYMRLGRHEEAEQCLRSALATRRRINDRHGEAESLADLATLLHTTDRPDAARASRDLSLSLFAELGVAATPLED